MSGKAEKDGPKRKRIRVGSVSLPLYPWKDPKTGRDYWRWSWKDTSGKWRYGTRADKEEAESLAQAQARVISNGKLEIDALSNSQMEMVRQFLALDPTPADLHRLREWREATATTLDLVVTRWHAAKMAEIHGKETPHLHSVHLWLQKLAAAFKGTPAASIGVDQLRGFIEGFTTSAKSRFEYRSRIVSLWQFADEQEIFHSKEAAKLPNYKLKVRAKIDHWTVDEMQTLLQGCPPEFLPWLVMSTFSGLRSEEISAKPGTKPLLDWSSVKRSQSIIDLPADISKVRKRRRVPITPTLAAWLDYLKPPKSGPVCPRSPSEFVTGSLGALIGGWRKNASRHSYGSFRAALEKNLPALAIEMGTSYPMIEKHYREAVEESEAKKYFALTPSEVFRK